MSGGPTSVLHVSLETKLTMGEHEKQMDKKSDVESNMESYISKYMNNVWWSPGFCGERSQVGYLHKK